MKSNIWKILVHNVRETGHGCLNVEDIAKKLVVDWIELKTHLESLEKEGYITCELGGYSHPNSPVYVSRLKKNQMEKDLIAFHKKWRYE